MLKMKEKKYFVVEITETLSRLVKVKAFDENEAFEKVRDSYENGNIILDEVDDSYADFEVFPEDNDIYNEDLDYMKEVITD